MLVGIDESTFVNHPRLGRLSNDTARRLFERLNVRDIEGTAKTIIEYIVNTFDSHISELESEAEAERLYFLSAEKAITYMLDNNLI
jgi:hypothetical protein